MMEHLIHAKGTTFFFKIVVFRFPLVIVATYVSILYVASLNYIAKTMVI